MKHIPFLYLLAMLINVLSIQSLVIIRGNNTISPYSFSAPITEAVLQKSTGTFFVGLGPGLPFSDSNFLISKVFRPNFISQPKFIGIATDFNGQNTCIEFLAVSDQTTCKTILPFVIKGANDFTANQVSTIFDNGDSFTQTNSLNDAIGQTSGGIVQLATSMARTSTVRFPSRGISNVFAAVRPNNGNFGDTNSGIAFMSLTCTSTAINVSTLDATTGQSGNVAEFLDKDSEQLKGDTGGAVEFSTAATDVNQITFYYDDRFERLYIGVRITTGAAAGDIGKSVVVGRVDEANALVLEAIAPDSAIDEATDLIVVAAHDPTQPAPNLRANHLGVMHTSAGPSYLIVQGGIGQTDEVGNLIFALPLVDNTANPSIHGTLANKDALLQDFKFTIPATLPEQLAFNTDPAAQIGAGPLPMLASDQISNMVVAGDAVFISIAKEPSELNDTGILYSQALFGANGKIIGWTPWTKRASPIDLFPNVTPSVGSGVQLFDVDQTTGNIYLIPAQQDNFEIPILVGVTGWTEQVSTSTASSTTLIDTLNDALPEGSYSVLDLPQSVRGFTGVGAPLDRYALFGGVNRVVFTRTSRAVNQTVNAPQNVVTDFSDPQNFLVTQLPLQAGCVQVLEYSRQTSDDDNTGYFFAGTENGLFAFANAQGEGFNVSDLSTLDQAPFRGGRWYKIPEIKGSVIDIKTSGHALYILTFETSAETPLKNTLYAVSFEPTLEEMFNPSFMNIRTLAETKTDPVFGTTQLFTGMQIIATGDPAEVEVTADKEQLILATNQGLYKSNANQANNNEGIADAEDQTAAMWELIQTTSNIMYTGISGIETPIRHTTWPISVQDQNGCRSLEGSNVEQLNSDGDPAESDTGQVGFAPVFFNANVDTPAFETLPPITYFFSDGGRRFLITNPTASSGIETKLSVIPFDAQSWHVTSPQTLKYPPLRRIERFFWVQTIGMSGIVLAGTNRGVIGLT